MIWAIFTVYATAFGLLGYWVYHWSYKRGAQAERLDTVTFLQQFRRTAVVQQLSCTLSETAQAWWLKESIYADVERCISRGWHEGEALRRKQEERRMAFPTRRYR